MRKVLTILLLLASFTIQASDKNLEVLLGLRLGGGWFTDKGSYDRSQKLRTTHYIYKAKGSFIPVELELLFNIKNIRIGYSFQYKSKVYSRSVEKYKGYDFYLQQGFEGSNVETSENPGNVIINSLLLEYAFRIKPRFAIAPSASIGFLGIISPGISSTASINFEIMDKKATTFVISPTYWYYNGLKQDIAGHTVSLEVAFRFRLTKKKSAVSTPERNDE